MASNLDYAEDIEEAKAYMAKKNVFQLFEVSNSAYFELIFFADAKMRSIPSQQPWIKGKYFLKMLCNQW